MNRAHLRSHNGVVLHVFAEWHAVGVFRHGGGIVCGLLRFADAVFRGTLGCGFNGFSEFRIGFHHGVKHDLTARSRRFGSGFAEFALLVGHAVLLVGHGCADFTLFVAFTLFDGCLE